MNEIKCIEYELKKIDYLPAASEDQFNVKPIYKTFPGWKAQQRVSETWKTYSEKVHAIEDFVEQVSVYRPERKICTLENPFDI